MAGFPKRVRLLHSSEFRRVYDQGSRSSGPLFAAFRLRLAQPEGPRIGFAVPRSLGGAVDRNRIRRRLREAVRLCLEGLNPQWAIVFHPRRRVKVAPFTEILDEVDRFFRSCK